MIGSPKQEPSTSESLGTYLIGKLQNKGFEPQTLFLHRSFKTYDRTRELLEAVNAADLIIIAFPLYIDCLPYLVIKMMEMIAQNRTGKKTSVSQRLVGIVNNGFPEPHQNDTAIAICMQFAKEAGFDWAGGLKLGGGEAINGKSLDNVNGMARHVIKSLDMAAAALCSGACVPKEAEDLMAKKFLPNWLFLWLGKMRWNRMAK